MNLNTAHLPIRRLRLPNQCHIPGTHTVAEHAWLDRITERTPNQVLESAWRKNLPYRYGWHLFLNHYYWETHEVWESVWLRTPVNSRERFLTQGLIQLANAGLKAKQGNLRAQARILKISHHFFNEAFAASQQSRKTRLMGISEKTAKMLIRDMQ